MPQEWEPRWSEDKGWHVSFSVKGRRIRRRLGIRDKGRKALARKAAQKIYDDEYKLSLEAPRKPGKTFYDAAAAYVHRGGEARFLPPLMKHFGPSTLVEDIDDDVIDEAAETLYPKASPATVQRQVRTPIKAVLRDATGAKRRTGVDVKRTIWLTPEQAERLIQNAGPALPKIAFLLGTGCRTGEMFAAEAHHLNRQTLQCWIAAEQDGANKTDRAARWVRFPPRAWEMMGDLPTEGRLFLTPKGQPYALRKNGGGQMQAAFNKARDAAGLGPGVTPHTLRHTWATWYYAQTTDFSGLMDHGGWEKAETANRYRKLAPDDLAQRLHKFGWDFGHKYGTDQSTGGLRVVK